MGAGLLLKVPFWKSYAGIAITNFVDPFTSNAYIQVYLPSNVVGVLFSLIPLATIHLSVLLLRVKTPKRKFIGVVIGLVGLVAISEPKNGLTTLEWIICFQYYEVSERLSVSPIRQF